MRKTEATGWLRRDRLRALWQKVLEGFRFARITTVRSPSGGLAL
jgi:hypothetical protein